MKEFDYKKIIARVWDKEILNYIGMIHEFKGRQQLYLSQNVETLDKLVEIAKLQSTESSNEIEGIVTSRLRLKQLLEDKTKPKNRSEEEILGYKYVLSLIHGSHEAISIRPNNILQLHKELYSFTDLNFGGKYKDTPNEIDAIYKNGIKKVIFKPLEPFETPFAIERICEEFNKAINNYGIDPLIVIPIFIHDFLCIHPFNDGNGRMSRLLTTLLLYRSGFYVGKYISLEKKIQTTKSDYYKALSESSKEWINNKNDDTPFVKYTLSIILSAYKDFEERVNLFKVKLSAKDLVINAINKKLGAFTKNDIQELCPEISIKSIEKALKELCSENKVKKFGINKSTYYISNM